jgi:hypothetical protein
MRYSYQGVDQIPRELEPGIVYHSEEFELAALLCACGCRHRITLLVPDGHQVWDRNGLATINPSVGVLDAPCKSHFFVTSGAVEWLPAFSDHQAVSIMRAQIARHAAGDAKRPNWLRRLWAVATALLTKLGAMLAR